jgi:hypothetical protein
MMVECLIYVLLVSAVASLVSLGSDNERWVKMVVGVALSSFLAVTLLNTVRGIELPEYSESTITSEGEKIAEEVLSESFAAGVRADICAKFYLSEDDVSVSAVGFTYGSELAESLTVRLRGKAVVTDTSALRKYVDENFGKCEVITDFE